MEPPVSVPMAPSAMPATSAAADPPLDPPADRLVSSGLRTAPNAESSLVVPSANSWRLVLPTSTAPAALSRAVTMASEATGVSGRTCEAAVVGTPAWSIRSLSAIGMPCSGPRSCPLPSSRSACLRRRTRLLAGDRDECPQLVVARGDVGQARVGERFGRQRLRAQAMAGLDDVEQRRISRSSSRAFG